MLFVRRETITQEIDVIYRIDCDRCHKDLGKDQYDFKGGYITLASNWCSSYDNTLIEDTRVTLCDECLNQFYCTFLIPRGQP